MSIPAQTIARLRDLKLLAMALAYELQLEQPKLHELAFDDRFGLIVEQAASQKDAAKIQRLIKQAKLEAPATLEDIDYSTARGLDKGQIAALASCDWINRKQNVIIVGPTGVGKTWLASAIGAQACRLGMPVIYRRAIDLFDDIAKAELDGQLTALRSKLIRAKLLVIDDFGLGQISPLAALTLFDVVDRRLRVGSLLITSQFPTEKWHDFFGDGTLADALLDRVVHRAHRIVLRGESMRKVRAREEMSVAR